MKTIRTTTTTTTTTTTATAPITLYERHKGYQVLLYTNSLRGGVLQILYQLSFPPERSDSFGPLAIQAFQFMRSQHGHAPDPRQRCISFCQYVAFENTSYPQELRFVF